MASPPTSEAREVADGVPFRLLTADGTTAPAPREWEPMLVEVRCAADRWADVTVLRQGVPLSLGVRRIAGRPRLVAEWPRSGPGQYHLRLVVGRAVHDVTVEVRPAKITSSDLAGIIEELQSTLPVSIALALQRMGGLVGTTLVAPRNPTLAEELERMRTAIRGGPQTSGLSQLLPALARDPHYVLKPTELWVRREHARRPHPARIAQALLRPGNLDATHLPLTVADARVEHSADVYENRIVQTFARQVERRLRRLRLAFQAMGKTAQMAEAAELLGNLRTARRAAPFLDGVAELTGPPTRLTMVLLRRPVYHAALEAFLRFQRGVVVRVEDPALDAPLAELPYLYQLWGTLNVVDTLLEVAADLGYQVRGQRLVGRDGNGYFLRPLPDGAAAVHVVDPTTGAVAQLIPERAYGEWSGGRFEELGSVSYQQRPDVAIEVDRPGEAKRVYLFDPKYKLDGEASAGTSSRPLKVDVDKMHAYRDAIRDASGRRVVGYAAILYPGESRRFGTGIEAIGAVPSAAPAMRARLREVVSDALGTSRQ
jgi:hypothetical protein